MEIGANTTIDRATLGDTVVRRGHQDRQPGPDRPQLRRRRGRDPGLPGRHRRARARIGRSRHAGRAGRRRRSRDDRGGRHPHRQVGRAQRRAGRRGLERHPEPARLAETQADLGRPRAVLPELLQAGPRPREAACASWRSGRCMTASIHRGLVDPRRGAGRRRAGRPLLRHRARGDDRARAPRSAPTWCSRAGSASAPAAAIGHGAIIGGVPQDLKFREGTPVGVAHRRRHGDPRVRHHPSRHPRGARHDGRAATASSWPRATSPTTACSATTSSSSTTRASPGTSPSRTARRSAASPASIRSARIGTYAYIGGCSKVTQDVPPFVIADGVARGRARGERDRHAPRRHRRRLAAAGAGRLPAALPLGPGARRRGRAGPGGARRPSRWWRALVEFVGERPSAASSAARAGAAASDARSGGGGDLVSQRRRAQDPRRRWSAPGTWASTTSWPSPSSGTSSWSGWCDTDFARAQQVAAPYGRARLPRSPRAGGAGRLRHGGGAHRAALRRSRAICSRRASTCSSRSR